MVDESELSNTERGVGFIPPVFKYIKFLYIYFFSLSFAIYKEFISLNNCAEINFYQYFINNLLNCQLLFHIRALFDFLFLPPLK